MIAFLAFLGFLWMLSHSMPRQWARGIDGDAGPDSSYIGRAGHAVASRLYAADRKGLEAISILPKWTQSFGAQPLTQAAPPTSPGGRAVSVKDVDELRAALEAALPGDVITLGPGTYRINDEPLRLRKRGERERPITLRGQPDRSARLLSLSTDTLLVSAPFWVIEGLSIRGTCQLDDNCDHAIRVIGDATNLVVRHNLIEDFNAAIQAQLNITGRIVRFPDQGLVEYNTIRNNRPRETTRPVAAVNIIAASRWQVSRNIVSDFVKTRGNHLSYGLVARGGGEQVRFDSNLIVCEQVLTESYSGLRVGIALGASGSAADECRERRCLLEQDSGVIANNLIARCSDVGVFVSHSANTRLEHNTIIDTAGVEARYLESSMASLANIVDGPVRAAVNARISPAEDYRTYVLPAFFSIHRARRLFEDPLNLNLAPRAEWPKRSALGEEKLDLCGQPRGMQPRFGAIENWQACLSNGASEAAAAPAQAR